MPYRVTVQDQSKAAYEAALEAFDLLAREIQTAAKMGAAFERANHTYVSRSGDLQRSTQGKLIRKSREEIRAELSASAPYASYVQRRGFMAIGEASIRVGQAIEDAMRKFEPRI